MNLMQNDIFTSTKNTVLKYSMLRGVGSVLCALSGGADSVVLLHVLKNVLSGTDTRLRAVHVNHCIRGDEAQRDEDFCRALCGGFDIPLVVRRVDAPAFAKEKGIGLEEAARELRYRVFSEVLEDGEVVATAHNATDNAETVLFNLIRGAGSRGLAGIPPVRDNIIRPLIASDRDQIRSFAKQNGIEYVEDSTNSDTVYTRNFIRAEIIPRAKKLNPSFEGTVLEASRHLREEDGYFTSAANEFIAEFEKDGRIPCDGLCSLAPPVAFRAVGDFCKKYGCGALSSVHVEAVLALAERKVPHSSLDLPGGMSVVVENGELTVRKSVRTERKVTEKDLGEAPLSFGVNSFDEKEYDILLLDAKSFKEFQKKENIYKLSIFDKINFDKIKSDVYARTRRSGDAYRARSVTKTVRRMMSEKKLPLEKRDTLPVICDGEGIVWVPGFPVADRVYPEKGEEITYICYCEK